MQLDMSAAWTTVRSLAHGFISSLPRFVLALLIIVVFYIIARIVRAVIRRAAHRRGDHGTLELAVGRLVQAGILLIGVLVAVTAAFPGFTPANLVSTLGIGGVAIGFAFKDIFQNFLAGILILITRPFRVGDQIVFRDYEGTVEEIMTRATYLKTYDGRRVVIPNGELFTNSVTVNTAFETRRWEYDFGIGYGDDIEQARKIILDVLIESENVEPDPGADVIMVDLAEYTVNLRARWWAKSRGVDGLLAKNKVLTRVKESLAEAGIDLPYPTRQVLLHDQTEETDGDRRAQREGWPAGKDRDVPRPAYVARRDDARGSDARGDATRGDDSRDDTARDDSARDGADSDNGSRPAGAREPERAE